MESIPSVVVLPPHEAHDAQAILQWASTEGNGEPVEFALIVAPEVLQAMPRHGCIVKAIDHCSAIGDALTVLHNRDAVAGGNPDNYLVVFSDGLVEITVELVLGWHGRRAVYPKPYRAPQWCA